MVNQNRPRGPRVARCVVGAATALLLAGCQSYRQAPLDLEANRTRLSARSADTETLQRFSDRLAAMGQSSPARFDPSDGLSPPEGEALALFYNPDLRLARLDAGVALANRETAGLWEDPEFGFDAAEILSPAGLFEYGLRLSLTIPVSGRLGVEKDRAGAAYEAELRRIVDAEWNTRFRVRSAWAVWAAASERVRLLRNVDSQVERIVSITDRLESAGELTRVEARLVRTERLSVAADLIDAERAEANARFELLGLMGLAPDAPVELIAAFPVIPQAGAPDKVQRLIDANTSLAARRAEYHVAEETLRLEVRKQYPDIAIGGGYGAEDDDRLLLGVSLPIPILNANRAGIAEATARREVARAAAETAFERLTRRLASAEAELEAARRQRRAFELELVPMLERQSEEVERLAELGEVDTLLLLETVTRGFEARSDLLALRVAEVVSMNEIARLLGPESDRDPAPVIGHPGPESTPGADTPAQETNP